MKNLVTTFFLTIIFLLSPKVISAQDLEIADGHILHEDKLRPCVTVNIGAEMTGLKDSWQDYMKDNYDIKIKGRNIMDADKVRLEQVSSNTIDLFTDISQNSGSTVMKIWASKGYDIFIGPDNLPVEYASLKSIVINFVKQSVPEHYSALIIHLENKIADITDDKKDLKNDLSKSNDKIEDLMEEISETQNELDVKEDRLNELRLELDSQKSRLDRIRKKLQEL